ncbi:TetR family transcriptional regulator [Nocardia inohanensis]|uniref:TetR family transcriptional regulator n=1 Tax=Nocardia inohanensis TaxID=209246 RepID=UPI0008365969|nr:TetR family transcriptional regulator [Nocardia inohanensis]
MFDNKPAPRVAARPAPVQRRGVERVQALLDAAEALLAEQGYAAATLKAMGERAGIPLASVYHYFADRGQVETELAQRHLRELDERVGTMLATATGTLPQVCDAVIDLYLDYFRDHPSFAVLWFAGRTSTLDELASTFDVSQAARLWRHLLDRELLLADTPMLVVELAFEAGDRVFDVAFRKSPTGDDATIEQARRLVSVYLSSFAPES